MTSAFLFTTWSMKPGILVREAVVVLAPDVRAEQVVERRDRPPPRDVARHLQPLRVLVEHRVDDVDERLVAVEEAVPAGQQVALEPALAEVLGEHLDHAAVRAPGPRRSARVSASQARSVTSKTSPSRFDAVSSGPKRRKFVGVARRSRRAGTRRARASPRSSVVPGCGHLDGVVAEVGQDEVAQELAAVRVRVRAHPAVARAAASSRSSADERARRRRTAPRAGSSAATPRAAAGGRRCPRTSASGTWCERHVPSIGRPSTSFGPGPALGRAQDDHRPARPLGASPSRARAAGCARSRRARRRARRRSAGATSAGPRRRSRPRRRAAGSRSPRRARAARRSGIRASTVGFAIL